LLAQRLDQRGPSFGTVSFIGTGGILVAILLIVGAVIVGFLMGGMNSEIKKVLALGTGQRNLAAAFAIATSNFANNPDVLLEIMDIAVIGFVILMIIAGELGRHSGGNE
jgi:predicted Na+-dependent transporter